MNKTYIEMQKEEVYFKIVGENKINEILNYSLPLLIDIFKGEIGKPILKAHSSVTYGELLKKYKNKTDILLKEIENKFKNDDINPICYLKVDSYSIYLNVQLRFNNLKENGFIYYDGYKYILNLVDGVLKNIYEFKPEIPINADEQYKIFLNCLELKRLLEEEKNKLNPYGLQGLIK
jgi:hypothetical protein